MGGREGEKGAWDEVVCLPRTQTGLRSVCREGACASQKAFSCTGHQTQVAVAGPKISHTHMCVGGALSPLLWLRFSPNSLDSQQSWIQAGPWAADTSKTAQDRASGPPEGPRGVGLGPPPTRAGGQDI